MPYDLKLMEQESHGGVGRPGSPYRLSPREHSKASPQPDGSNAARYSVPPGKQSMHPVSRHNFLDRQLVFVQADMGTKMNTHQLRVQIKSKNDSLTLIDVSNMSDSNQKHTNGLLKK